MSKPTFRLMLVCLSVICELLFTGKQFACGFATYLHNYHGDITSEALTSLGFSEDVRCDVVKANRKQDWDESRKIPPFRPNGNYRPEHHFDRNPTLGVSSATAFINGLDYASREKQAVIDDINRERYDFARAELGRGLHALQDFYAHSNYVEIGNARCLPTTLPAGLHLTSFDPKADDPENPQSDFDTASQFAECYTHEKHAKDTPTKNDDAKTHFWSAYRAAVNASICYVEEIRDAITKGEDDPGGNNNRWAKWRKFIGRDGSNGGKDHFEGKNNGSIVTSGDPNELAGPQGFGAQHWTTTKQPMSYKVHFENLPTASAPAAEISVTDHLDAAKLDMTTVKLQSLTFAGQTVTPTLDVSLPVGKRQFHADVDLRPAKNLIVRTEASLDMLTGDLIWHFTSLDPNTMQPPDDPLAGFLDPGQEGSVLFSVLPKPDVPTGTIVNNQASIKFDFNAWMDTNVWFNTIDSDKPTSMVEVLLATQNSASFAVSWKGADLGSGLRDYTVSVSDNGGLFTTWLSNTTDTSATFTGQAGHTYAFLSQARDNVYNLEDAHTLPDATTKIAAVADVSSQVSIQRGGFRLNKTTGRFVQTVTLTNTSGVAIAGSVSLVLDGLSSNVSLFNKTGVTSVTVPSGRPYRDAQTGDLAAGASVTVTLEFTNSDIKKGIGYSTRVLAGAGSR